jgi:glycosyltransferase involved in cell wall biosynthesis
MTEHANPTLHPAPAHQIWCGWARDASGFADELRGFLRAAEARGDRPSLMSFGDLVPTELTEADARTLAIQERRQPGERAVAIHSYVPWMNQPTVADLPNVVRAMFETDRLPQRRLATLLDRDEVWVPGDFMLETFERGGVPRERMHVLGGTLDFDLFRPDGVEPADFGAPADHFTFLTNFAFSERKGWRQLLRAWALAFGPDDGAALILKVHSEGRGPVLQRISAFLEAEHGSDWAARTAPIVVVDDVLAATEMPRLYAAADAYVLPTRGEGWGRPYMEAMAMGLPTIGSRWSGNLEFMHDGNSWLVDGELVPVEHGVEVFGYDLPGHQWFEPDVESLVAQLRAVAGDRAGARAKAATARGELLERFGPEPTAARVAELTAAAWERHHERRAKPAGFAFRGPAGSTSSLAVVNDALADGLLARGHNFWRFAEGHPVHETFEGPVVSHAWPPAFEQSGTGPSVVILPWEYGAAPAEWVTSVNELVDRVWVPSEYVRQGYIESGMAPGAIEVVPNGVDLEAFTPEGPELDLGEVDDDVCTFLFVGGTIWRKGADLLLGAWAQAFGPDDRVRLVIKDFGAGSVYRGQSVIGDPAALAHDPRLAPVVHLADEVAYADLPALYRAADVAVLPYRAEGFCLPALEAMACGVPVIHNAAGPTGEFVPADGGWALDGTRRPAPRFDAMPLAREGWVHEVSVEELAAALRAAAGDAAERGRRGAVAAEAAQRHGWDAVVDRAEASLAQLAAEPGPTVRTAARESVEGQDTIVLFAPDWTGDDWQDALGAWALTVSPSDPVTLALTIGDADPEALMDRVGAVLAATGRADEELPDFAVCPASPDRLVLSADAVLLDAAGPAALPPFTARRASRLLDGDATAIAAFVAALAPAQPLAA